MINDSWQRYSSLTAETLTVFLHIVGTKICQKNINRHNFSIFWCTFGFSKNGKFFDPGVGPLRLPTSMGVLGTAWGLFGHHWLILVGGFELFWCSILYRTTMKQGGWRTFFNGFGATMARALPQHAVVFSTSLGRSGPSRPTFRS